MHFFPGPAGPFSLKTGHWPVFRALRTPQCRHCSAKMLLATYIVQGLPARCSVKTGHWPVFRALATRCGLQSGGSFPLITPSLAPSAASNVTIFTLVRLPWAGHSRQIPVSPHLKWAASGWMPPEKTEWYRLLIRISSSGRSRTGSSYRPRPDRRSCRP